MMVPTPARPAAEQDEPATSLPAEPVSAFPDIGEYVDLVTELEEILRGAAGEAIAPEAADIHPSTSAEAVELPPEAPIVPAAARPAPLRAPARVARTAPQEPPEPVADDPAPSPDTGFWQVDDSSWARAPAWRETRRARGLDLFIIGALVVLIAGGGAYSALRLGDDAAPESAREGLVADASRAETGLGVPFAPVGRAGLLRNDPTAPFPSLDVAIAGAEVPPLPVIIEPPLEVTRPIFLADAGAAPAVRPAPLAEPAAAAAAGPADVGGPLVAVEAADPEGGVAVAIVTTVTTWVNMRAGPDNGEPVVMVVSPETPVSVRACDYWCSVTVNGRDGYIFKDFLLARP